MLQVCMVVLACLLAQPLPLSAQPQVPPIRPPIPILRFLFLPDLEVVGISCIPPDGVLSFTVRNNGPGVMPRDWRTGPELVAQICLYYYELDLDVPLGELDLRTTAAEHSGGGIDLPGGTSTYITDIVIGWAEAGYPVKIAVDSSDAIRELNESNNTLRVSYSPCGRGVLPDLEVVRMFVSLQPLIPGVTDLDQLITVSVRNLGKEPALGTRDSLGRGYLIDFVLSSDEVIPVNPTVLRTPAGPVSIPLPSSYYNYQEDMLIGRIPLTDDVPAEGEVGYMLARFLGEQVIELPHAFPGVEWTGPYRTFYLFAIIDPLNRVEEAREDNNIFSVPVQIERPIGG